ncbi:MAG: HAMP domain-containing sensor histidine kinase [Bacteroidota bacterium]
MNAKPYKVIFKLLVLGVAAVLLLQGFWIRNFYLQKQDEFNSRIYSALEQVSARLRERQGLRVIRQHMDSEATFQPDRVLSGKPSVNNNIYVELGAGKKPASADGSDAVKAQKRQVRQVKITDSVVKVLKGGQTIITRKEITGTDMTEKEMNQLMDKMITEIRIIDKDEKNPDTLKAVISDIFSNKGIFIPFEYALKKVLGGKEEILSQSPGYKDSGKSFVTDLSANNVFSTHHFLFIQFPGQGNYVFTSIKNMLLLSLAFSLLIIGVFYYTMRLIMKQKRLSEIKNDFVNNMTHELKTPIATNALAIDALTNPLVKNDELRFQDYIRILKEENQKLNIHVERVLQMALLDKGELPLQKSGVDLAGLIKSAVDHHKLQINEKGATINVNTPSTKIMFNADGQHLQTVFSNLLDNAIKYSKEKCVIDITIAEDEDGISVCFKDNGIGIEKEHREKVFDKFYRAQGGNLHDVKGFGLGLSYVKSVVEAHQGHITLKSEGGRGSEFTISFKAA